VRPDTSTIADFRSLFGTAPPAGVITAQWLADRRLARARLSTPEELFVDLENPNVRRDLEQKHARLLASHDMQHLDISQLRSTQRVVTQTIALDLYDTGKAGIIYRSTIDNETCVAVFERRVTITPYGAPRALHTSDPDLVAISAEWDLHLEP